MKYYKTAEFAKLIGVSKCTLIRWDKKNILKAKRTPTGYRYYTDNDLKVYFNSKI